MFGTSCDGLFLSLYPLVNASYQSASCFCCFICYSENYNYFVYTKKLLNGCIRQACYLRFGGKGGNAMEEAIRVERLKKYYHDVKAVDDITFSVAKGEFFGFLGVNGAGKSTTINMLCTLQEPTGGEAWVNGLRLGKENEAIKKHIGVVYQNNCLDKMLTVNENLLLRGSLYETDSRKLKKNLSYVTEILELGEVLKRPFGKLSGGQKRRCEIARALMHTPDILFLDEPTTGLDPATRKSVWETVRMLQREMKMTVFLTTHYMEEAAKADHIGIMSHGHFVEYGTPFSLKETYAKDKLYLIPADQRQSLPGEKRAVKRVSVKPKSAADCREEIKKCLDGRHFEYTIREEGILVKIDSTLDALPLLQEMRGMLQGFEVIQGTMDDVFLNVTKKMDDVFVQDAKEDENEKVC